MNWSLAELKRRLAANPDLALENPDDLVRSPVSRAVRELNPDTVKALMAQDDAADELEARIRTLAPDLPPPIRDLPFKTFRIDLAWPDTQPPIAVEVDGGQHASGGGKHGSARDYQKTRQLTAAGWFLLRFTASEVRNDPLGVIAEIREMLR